MARRRYRPLPAGQRTHRIRIERVTVTRDAIGGGPESWALLAKRWASFSPSSAREIMEGQRLEGKVLSPMVFPHVATLTPKDRIKEGTRTFNIRKVINPEERNIETHVLVEEIV